MKLVAGDLTNDAFIDNPTKTRVELGSKSDGTPRAPKTDFVIEDNGNVGINTGSPSQPLHIAGNTRIEGNIYDGDDTAGIIGEVLTVDGTKVKWKPLKKVIFAILGAGYSGNSLDNKATGTTITLPPGKWILNTNILINTIHDPSSTQGVWVRLTWSNTPGGDASSDIIGSDLVSGALVGPVDYGMAVGITVINNTTGVNKTYYLTKKNQEYYGWLAYSKNFDKLAGTGVSENNIFAIPSN